MSRGNSSLVRKLILKNEQAPGDILMLTAAVRDLHRSQAGRFAVDVRTPFPELWEGNPFIIPLSEHSTDVETIDCEYPLIHESNRLPVHFLHAFPDFLGRKLGVRVDPTEFRADVYLSRDERERPLPLKLNGEPVEHYWIVAAGGKRDFTIKWWSQERYQAVIDHFRGRLVFVQVGGAGHFHPKLEGVIDLRGRTSIRDLIRLVHHADGVLTPVSFLMHLTAAVPVSEKLIANEIESRPCVVIAGGREPVHWEAYPTHQYLHTVGALDCCRTGGCWRSRTKALGDGSEHDSARRLCVNVRNSLPACMDMITADDAIRRIELFLEGQERKSRRSAQVIRSQVPAQKVRSTNDNPPLEIETVHRVIANAFEHTQTYPESRFSGRGVVVVAGGPAYLACAWVCVSMLRRTGCDLPVQIWHFGGNEAPDDVKSLFAELRVTFVDAERVRKKHPVRRLSGWALKPYAILNCPYQEVLLLDADNVAVSDPARLFASKEYRETGALFWPDLGDTPRESPVWRIFNLPYVSEPEFESGQIFIDKRRCWRALELAMWINAHADFFYSHMYGDKDTFRFAFRTAKTPYAMPQARPVVLDGALLQHDFDGNVLFQHRGGDKWSTTRKNRRIAGFLDEKSCLALVKELARKPAWARFASISPAAGTGRKQRTRRRRRAKFALRAPINGVTGYGLHACQIVRDFLQNGVEVAVIPASIEERLVALPLEVKQRVVFGPKKPELKELLLHPPFVRPRSRHGSIYFTMWETNTLRPESVRVLNEAEMVVVPCRWNADVFVKSGVTSPIEIVPLGINGDAFRYRPFGSNEICVFGSAARLKESDPARKRIDQVIEAFLTAFPNEEDVQLHLKLFPDCEAPSVSDEKIRITRQYFTEEQLADWFAGLTCFVSASCGEGWGLMQQQAMAVGRPIISAFYGGLREFVNPGNSYIIPHSEVPAAGSFTGAGTWAQTDTNEMAAAMRQVYGDRDEAKRRGAIASREAHRFTWQESNRLLLQILRSKGWT